MGLKRCKPFPCFTAGSKTNHFKTNKPTKLRLKKGEKKKLPFDKNKLQLISFVFRSVRLMRSSVDEEQGQRAGKEKNVDKSDFNYS